MIATYLLTVTTWPAWIARQSALAVAGLIVAVYKTIRGPR